MNQPPKSLRVKVHVWRLLLPLRWVVSTQGWVLSRVLMLLSWAVWGLHVAIDYLRLMYLDYTARPDDVFVVTYPRSGTTWLQMILYQITTDGSMDLTHIAEVCPWFERMALNRRNVEKMPSPRVFKSHLPWIWIPKRNCRYIYCARNGKDVAVSFYHFYKSHFRYKGSFSNFFKRFMVGWVAWGSWFYHVKGWWKQRDRWNVLFLKYEDMIADLEGTVRQIIGFLEIDVPEEDIPRIVERSSFAFMKQHEMKFDFAVEMMIEHGVAPGTFIRKGKVGDWEAHFTGEEAERFNRRYEEWSAKLGLDLGASKPAEKAGTDRQEPAASQA
jgi:hypothetical protein